jgi:hypothetical protein
MTPLTEEVAAALALDDPSPQPCGAELVERVPPPAPPVAFPIPLVVRAGRVLGAAATALTKPFVRMLESAMEVIWDLLIFLALVAVGLVVLNLLGRRR